jgi:acyl-coenzyme A synthetase/AMP-(fatty) acid ligase
MEKVVTYRMLGEGIAGSEAQIAAEGLAPRAVVGLFVEDPIRQMALILALYRRGIVCVPLATLRAATDRRLGISAVLVDKAHAGDAPFREIVVGDDWFRSDAAALPPAKPFGDDENCQILLSSGSTGEPKPVWMPARATAGRIALQSIVMGACAWESVLAALGPVSGWGFSAIMVALTNGKTACMARAPDEALRMVALFRIGILSASIHQLRRMLESYDEQAVPCTSLRQINAAGSTFSWEMIAEVRAKLCNRVFLLYGGAEVGTVAYAPAERLGRVPGATGFVVPGARIDAVDAAGTPLPPETEGILRVVSPNQGRWNEPPEAIAPPRDWRWFYPGDLGTVSADGIVAVTGRVSEVINVGGVKLAPDRVERSLLRHPGVADAAVVGGPGANGIEEVRAIVIARDGLAIDDLKAWCAATMAEAAPQRFLLVDAIPRNQHGKVIRQMVRDMFAD